MSYTSADVLHVLNEHAANFTFPGFNNMNYHMGTARLTGFRDEQRWTLLFEEIVWWPAAEGIMSNLYTFGNCLQPKASGFRSWSGALEHELDDCNEVVISSISIRGVHPEIDEGAIAMEMHQVEAMGRRMPLLVPERGFWILVHLLREHREEILATQEELRWAVPRDLPQIIQLDNWHHPDVYGRELPSLNDSMLMLADVLATGDALRYQDPPTLNVDWRLWLERP